MKLNSKTYIQSFPLPVFDDIIDQSHCAKVLPTLDHKNAFFHFNVVENSQKYTTFVTNSGQFEFVCLNDAPLVFKKYIANVLGDLINEKKYLSFIWMTSY